MTKEEFLEKARDKHGYKYIYPSLKEKITLNDHIDILYKDILYNQSVSKHINLGRCPEKNTPKKTTEQFIEESKKIWGDKYDYSLVEYKGALKDVKIIFDGIIFNQKAVSHLCKLAPEFRLNKEYFLKKSIDKYGDKYDYSLVNFINGDEKVKIIYKNIIYEQSPLNHLRYSPDLLIITKTTDEFISQCRIIHNNKYSYENTIYTLSKNKVIITCPIHGDFEQIANTHYLGAGCIKCGYISMSKFEKKKKITEQFIEEAKLVWGDKYDYSLVDYISARKKVKIIYEGITYYQLPGSHLRYPVESFLNQEIFLIKSIKKWGDKYDYSLVNFKNCNEKVKIIHEGVVYEQLPLNHLVYAPEKRLKKTREEFIEESAKYHNNKYNYDKVIYTNDRMKVIIICPKHGEFKQTPSSHHKSGCPICNESRGEKQIAKFLNNHNINYNRQHMFDNCKNIYPLRFDFYVESKRTCIEFDGIQHFQPIPYFGGLRAYENLKVNDKIKSDYCEDNYINLVRIRYDEDVETILKLYI